MSIKVTQIISAVFLIMAVLMLPKSSLAHGAAQSFPKDVGVHTVEFEYDASGVFDDTTMAYVFRLLDQKSKEPVKFDSVLVRFENKTDKSTIFVSRVSADDLLDGVARVSALLGRADYKVYLIFYKDGDKLTETDYDLSVQKGGSQKFPVVPAVSALAGGLIGFVLGGLKKSSHGK